MCGATLLSWMISLVDEQEIAWVFVGAFTLMTGFALAPPLYRVIHGVPADDTFRWD